MHSGCVLLLLLLTFPIQTPRESFQLHYEKAEALRRGGDLLAAEAEYKAILGEAYFRFGRVAAAQSDYADSVRAFEAAASFRPNINQVLIELAIAYFHVEQYEKALEPLVKAVSNDPKSAAAHHMLGKTYFMLGSFDKAVVELQTALATTPNDYDVEYTLGLAYLKQRDLTAAKKLYDLMIKELGNKPQLRVLIGRAYRETGYLPEAIEEFQKAVALDPKFPRVHYYLGLTFLLKDGADRLGDAEREFKIELAEHPNEFFANYYLGIAATVQRNWQLGVQYLQKASQLQPDNPDPYFFLGQAFSGLEKYDLAIPVLKKSIALNPDVKHNDYQVGNAHYRLGQALVKAGSAEEGEKELKIAADIKAAAFKRDEARIQAFTSTASNKLSELVAPEGVLADAPTLDVSTRAALQKEVDFYKKIIAAAHNNIGSLRADRRDFRAAAEQFKLASKWDPNLPGANFNWGLACYKAELYSEAIVPFEIELKARPENIGAKQLLGLSYFMTNNYAKASALLAEVVAAKPDEATLYYPLALSLMNEKRIDEAHHFVEQMVARGANSPQVHILLGRAAYDEGDSEKALQELQTAIALDGKVLLAHFYSGVVFLKLGKFDEAKKQFEAELALNPNDLQAKYDLAYVLLAGQETERGISLMREVCLLKPDFADAHYELGKALLQKGEIDSAIENLQLAAKLDPDKAHIHYQLGRAYLAAGRKSDGDRQIEMSRQLKEKERVQANP
ncbi:MAG TPA: tetratricopeptide repeat protein [Pyrinomonadaceae bacterium]